MKVPVLDAAGKDGSPSDTARDTRAPIIVNSVTRGLFRRVRPIISCPFATVTMSAAARRMVKASGSMIDVKSQIALFTFLGTVDSSADPAGAFGRF